MYSNQAKLTAVQLVEIVIDLVLHGVVIRVSLKLVLGSVCQRAPATATSGTLHTPLHILLSRTRLPRCFAGCISLRTFCVVGFLQ